MDNRNDFYTQKGYELHNTDDLTASMEDYLEMICRMLKGQDIVRIQALSENLHVKPSSASKMVNALKERGYISFQKYGYLTATPKGLEVGEYLLYRHDILHEFLCLLNHSENELEQVEKIEHYINRETVANLHLLFGASENPLPLFSSKRQTASRQSAPQNAAYTAETLPDPLGYDRAPPGSQTPLCCRGVPVPSSPQTAPPGVPAAFPAGSSP